VLYNVARFFFLVTMAVTSYMVGIAQGWLGSIGPFMRNELYEGPDLSAMQGPKLDQKGRIIPSDPDDNKS